MSKTVTPQPQQLEQRSARAQWLSAALILLLVLLVGWSAFSPLDIVSVSQGTITPVSKVQQLQHLEGGIVEKIEVREGDRVAQGQPLVTLSTTTRASDVGELHLRIASLQADIHRLQAEAEGLEEITFPDSFIQSHATLIARTRDLFQARRSKVEGAVATQEQEIELKTQERAEIKARLRNTRERLLLVQEQITIGEELLKSNLSNRYEQIERLKEANGLQSRIDESSAALKRSQAAQEKAGEQLKQIRNDYQQEVQSALSESRRMLEEFLKRAEKLEDSLERTTLRAPVSGTIKRLMVVTEGGVIKPGDTVLEIVPGEDRLIVEAQLPPQDVGYVQVGQPAFVQLDAPDANRLGKIGGVVRHVSPDSMVTSEGQSFYVVHIALERDYFGSEHAEQGIRVDLFPGMIVSAGIVLGQRSVLEYLISPFTQQQVFVFTEL